MNLSGFLLDDGTAIPPPDVNTCGQCHHAASLLPPNMSPASASPRIEAAEAEDVVRVVSGDNLGGMAGYF